MLRKSVVCFMLNDGYSYDAIGSGTFVFHDGKLLIVSAAHVFEDLANKGEIYIHVNPVNKIFRLNKSKAFVSNKDHVNGHRHKDTLDIGAIIVPDEIIDICNGHISMVEEDFIENEENRNKVLFYQAIGYPGSKNTKLAEKSARTQRPFTPEILVYGGSPKSAKNIVNKEFTDEHHVILEWDDKKNFDDDQKKVNIPKPDGISGGLIQGCFDYIPHSNGLYPTCAAGIITEKNTHGKAMIGTRFSTIYRWLRMHNEQFK